jgi:hypothetical protein
MTHRGKTKIVALHSQHPLDSFTIVELTPIKYRTTHTLLILRALNKFVTHSYQLLRIVAFSY